MKVPPIKPIAAYHIIDGKPIVLEDTECNLQTDVGYRWFHLDLHDTALKKWAKTNLPDVAARALWQSETRPRCERLDDGLILNLRGVNLNPDANPEDMVSLRMWVTEQAIVSARLQKVWALDAIRQDTEAGKAPQTVGKFLAELAHGLTKRIEAVSVDLEEQTDALEEAAAAGDRLPTDTLSRLRQAVIKMRRFINPQREAISALAALDSWILEPDERTLIGETANRTRRIVEELDATRDRLSALQDHLDADRAHAVSRNSYVLSVVAAIFLPLGFLTGLFGVNIAGMPGTASPSAFWVLTGVSALIGVALFLIFRFSKWF